MEITEHEIVNVITIILSRLDELEDEQKKSKDFILELKEPPTKLIRVSIALMICSKSELGCFLFTRL